MTRFFAAIGGRRYPVSRVAWIGPADEKSQHTVALENGGDERERVTVSENVADEIADAVAYVPAAPGFYVLTYCYGDDGDGLDRAAVVAWAIIDAPSPWSASNYVEPVTVDGRNDGLSGIAAILAPNGTVTRPHDQTWASDAEFLKHEREQERQRREAAAND